MKRSLPLILAVVCGTMVGCGSQRDMSKSLENAPKHEFANKAAAEKQSSPEFIADHTESAVERANYLKGLTKDAQFDPKQHVPMLKKFENDPNADVAAAAKELLAKAQ
jgi:hypothetical protein